ncbi:MAG: UPF0104 family protein [Marinilabiliales bacterium]|nr:MAG: UPF0104 family protein [Marinilabiliales bacterium]
MRQALFKTTRILLFLSAGIFLLVLAFRDISLQELIEGLRSANYLWVVLSLAFASAAFISRTYRWIMLIEPLGYNPPVKNTFYALMTGYLANFILPRLGELTRCGSLNRTDRIPADALLGTVITERIADLLMLLLLALAVLLIQIEFFGDFLFNSIVIPLHGKVSSTLDLSWKFYLFAGSFLVLLIILYLHLASRLRRFSLFARSEKIVRQVIAGMISVFRMEKTGLFILHTLFIWLMYFLMTWALFMALPATAGLGTAAVLFILVIGGFGMAAPVQAGIGAYHWIVSVGLGLYDISREEGLVFATLSHESQALLMIVLGTFSLYMVYTISRKRKAASQPEC